MKVLIIGKGGREHGIAWKISKSFRVTEIFCAPGNVGTQGLAKNVAIEDSDIEGLVSFAKENKIDLTIVGPESTLALGVVNRFRDEGLKIFGPTKEATQIESSKEFAKKLMKKYNVPTADYRSFSSLEESKKYILENKIPIVIKEDGLKSGKGVTVAFSMEEALESLEKAFTIQENKVVIEEYLEGVEFSLIVMISGDIAIPLEVAQDHKRVFDNDEGQNTGGMGVYSPVPKIDKKIVEESMEKIIRPTIEAMKKEGVPFTGFLFAGLMLTEDGVKTIEFNARMGDPETQVILPRMKSDFFDIIIGLLENEQLEIEWDKKYALGVVLASEGYPERVTKDAEISIGNISEDTLLFHMGTKIENGKLLTDGGRVLIPVTMGETLKIAKGKAYEEIKKIKCDKLFYRTDIGDKSL